MAGIVEAMGSAASANESLGVSCVARAYWSSDSGPRVRAAEALAESRPEVATRILMELVEKAPKDATVLGVVGMLMDGQLGRTLRQHGVEGPYPWWPAPY